MKRALIGIAAGLLLSGHSASAAEPIAVVAAENFYGEVAAAIGGDRVAVTNVLMSPDADPHEFEPTPSVARSIADARIIVFNGADYDHWMERLLEAAPRPNRVVIEAASLIGVKEGENPHVWYDPRTMPAVAKAIVETLARIDPSSAAEFEARRAAFVATLAPVDAKIAEIKKRFAGAPVTATEPVFGYMATALGLDMRNLGFQMDVMHEIEPSAREVAAMEADLKQKKVRALFYNPQVSEPTTEHLKTLAGQSGVPVVGITETIPPGMSYADWMLNQLDATEKALAAPSS